jgi:hypothetical protein
MRYVLFTTTFLMASSGFALADACSDLVRQAQAALSSPEVGAEMRTEFERLLDVGKSGDIASCEGATTGSINQSPMPGAGPSGRRCSKTPDTV